MAKRDFAKIEKLAVELFWTVHVYRTESHDYSLYSLFIDYSLYKEKRRLKSR